MTTTTPLRAADPLSRTTVCPRDSADITDTQLLTLTRSGDSMAFTELYRRHHAVALHVAARLAYRRVDAEDWVAESFTKVFAQLRAGAGPTSAFRAYLLRAVRNTAIDAIRRRRREELVDDIAATTDAAHQVSAAADAALVTHLDQMQAAAALAMLPTRWQDLLWHIEVLEQPPAEIADALGTNANTVSARAYRARRRLRAMYLELDDASAA